MREFEHIVICRSCGASIIFLRTKNRKMIPCDADTVEHDDYQFDFKKHKSHFATCPNAAQHRK